MPADIAQKLLLLAIFVLACSGAAGLLDRSPGSRGWPPGSATPGTRSSLSGSSSASGPCCSVTPGCPGRCGQRLPARWPPGPAPGGCWPGCCRPERRIRGDEHLGAGGAARRRARPTWRRATPARPRLASGAAALAVLVACSLPWLVPSLLRTVYADPAGVAAYAARADTPFGSLGSLLMLGGGWNAQTVPAATAADGRCCGWPSSSRRPPRSWPSGCARAGGRASGSRPRPGWRSRASG